MCAEFLIRYLVGDFFKVVGFLLHLVGEHRVNFIYRRLNFNRKEFTSEEIVHIDHLTAVFHCLIKVPIGIQSEMHNKPQL